MKETKKQILVRLYKNTNLIKKEERKKKIMLFAHWVSKIDTSKYKKKQIIEIILCKYWKIFGGKK